MVVGGGGGVSQYDIVSILAGKYMPRCQTMGLILGTGQTPSLPLKQHSARTREIAHAPMAAGRSKAFDL